MLLRFELGDCGVNVELVHHVRLFVIVWRKNAEVDDVLQSLETPSVLKKEVLGVGTDDAALAVLLLLDCWCFPNFAVVFRNVKVSVVPQAILNHHVVVGKFECLYGIYKYPDVTSGG